MNLMLRPRCGFTSKARDFIPASWSPPLKRILILLAALCALRDVPAQTNNQAGFVAVTEEDDSFSNPFGTHTDRHYTQGLKFSLFGADDFMTNTSASLNRLPAVGFEPEARNLGVVWGQNIYTPQNLLTPALVPGDRPYAGWLYAGAVFQRRGDLATNFSVMENLELDLGVVGPWSLAAEAQKTVHRLFFPSDVPNGWDNQLRNEPGVIIKYGRSWRYSPTPGLERYMDVIPRIGADLGNVWTFGTAGVMGRLGFGLPRDFGPEIIDSPTSESGSLNRESPRFFFYAFVAADGRAVGRDITLDGNTFRGGPSVDKFNFVGDGSWGFAFQAWHHFEFSYTHITRTKEFIGQAGDDVFGSLNFKVNFSF